MGLDGEGAVGSWSAGPAPIGPVGPAIVGVIMSSYSGHSVRSDIPVAGFLYI